MDEKKGKEQSLIHHAKELGIYEQNDRRPVIEQKLNKYWIDKCGGYDEYMKATIFQAEKQDIARERKPHPNQKRKLEFVEDGEEKIENKPKSSKKKILDAEVCSIIDSVIFIFADKQLILTKWAACSIHIFFALHTASKKYKSNGIYLDMNGFMPERYYRLEFKIVDGFTEQRIDDEYYFKVIR